MGAEAGGGKDVLQLVQHLERTVPVIAIATETAAAMFSLASYAQAVPPPSAWPGVRGSVERSRCARQPRCRGTIDRPLPTGADLCLLGARAAGIEPIDTVYLDFRDSDGLARECEAAMRDGFSAKLAIHPDQIDIINDAFTPSAAAIAEARAVIEALRRQATPASSPSAAGCSTSPPPPRRETPRPRRSIGADDFAVPNGTSRRQSWCYLGGWVPLMGDPRSIWGES